MHLYERKRWPYRRLIGSLLLFLLLAALIVLGVGRMSRSADAGQKQYLTDAIRAAAVDTYATQGRYPQSLEEIISRYGIIIDEKKYVVSYEVFAANIMPDIRVSERGERADAQTDE